jgi:hypothetical protein
MGPLQRLGQPKRNGAFAESVGGRDARANPNAHSHAYSDADADSHSNAHTDIDA